MAMAENQRLGPAREDALTRLVTEGTLSTEQADAVREAFAAERARPAGEGWLVEASGYVGGCLLLAGIGLFLATSWETMTRLERSGLLAGLGVAFALVGLGVGGGPSGMARLRASGVPMRRRIVGVLFAVSSVALAIAAGVAVTEHPGTVGSLVGVVSAVAGLVAIPTVPGILASAVMSIVAITSFGGEVLTATPMEIGLMTMALGGVWLGVAAAEILSPSWLLFSVGALFCLVGAQQPMGSEGKEAWAYGLTLLVGVGCFVLYRHYQLAVLLIAGVLGVTIAVPEAVGDWTEGAIGGAAILLVAGATLIGASLVGLRMRTKPDTSE